MTRWKKLLVAASTGATLVVMATVAASASGPGQTALRSAGAHVVLAASSTAMAGPRGGVASGPGLGPIQVFVGDRWSLQGQLTVHGTVTITCGPFLAASGSNFAQVTVEEAQNDRVAHAPASLQLTCDGSQHAYAVAALVNDIPFGPVAGAVGVNANACGQDPASLQFACQSGSAVVPVTVK